MDEILARHKAELKELLCKFFKILLHNLSFNNLKGPAPWPPWAVPAWLQTTHSTLVQKGPGFEATFRPITKCEERIYQLSVIPGEKA